MRSTLRLWTGLVPVRLVVYLALIGAGLYAVLQLFVLYLDAQPSDPFVRWAAWAIISPYLHLACAISALLIYCGLVAYFEKRPISELAGPKPVRMLMTGVLLGVGLVAIYYVLLMLLGNATIQATRYPAGDVMINLRYAALQARRPRGPRPLDPVLPGANRVSRMDDEAPGPVAARRFTTAV